MTLHATCNKVLNLTYSIEGESSERMDAKELGDLLGVSSLEKLLGYERGGEMENGFTCSKCGKTFKSYHNVSRHETFHCKKATKLPILKMKWDGETWKVMDRSKLVLYHIKLGYQLDKLIKNETISEDVLNGTQKNHFCLYRKLVHDIIKR